MVVWSKPARDDLKAIHDFIKKDSIFYAKKVSDDIIEKSELLEQFPQMGRVVPEINKTDIRELFVYSYRMIYEISGKNVNILTLVHFAQDFKNKKKTKRI